MLIMLKSSALDVLPCDSSMQLLSTAFKMRGSFGLGWRLINPLLTHRRLNFCYWALHNSKKVIKLHWLKSVKLDDSISKLIDAARNLDVIFYFSIMSLTDRVNGICKSSRMYMYIRDTSRIRRYVSRC